MAELIWNINGKYFKDFGVFVSDSKGIMDEPNQKKTDTYDWAEYHGLATNLQSKPKYEAREFELSCWVKGADWIEMRNNFDAIMAEFRKAGKQRLTLDIFGEKTYVWDVNINGKVELKKQLQKGVQVGVFTIKLIEYNPIKKVLTTTKPNLQLSFNSPKWVEVNIDGKNEILKGVVNINKSLQERTLSPYYFEGRNYFIQGDITRTLSLPQGSPQLVQNGNFPLNTEFAISFYARVVSGNGRILHSEFNGGIGATEFTLTTKLKRHTAVMSTDSAFSLWYLWMIDSFAEIEIKDIMIVKGNKPMEYVPAPEDKKLILIAGNVDEITNLTTNADVLWERL